MADFSYEETTPPDSPHVGSNTDASQPYSPSRDPSDSGTPLYSEARQKNQGHQLQTYHHQPGVVWIIQQ